MFGQEFNGNKILQWALGALIFNYFIVFFSWIGGNTITKSAISYFDYVCPPYWQNCQQIYVLESLPLGYSQTFFYMLLFGGLLWAVYLLSEKRWYEAQLLLGVFFLWHAGNVFILTEAFTGNYEYYLVGFGIILLFLPHKEFFLKLFIVFLYVLSTVAKIHPAWIEGSYFTNLSLGLPVFVDSSIPFFTNLVILAEMVGSWFLLSANRLLQRTALIFFVTFHLYSGILVEYRYPATVLPMILILFGPWYRYQVIPLDRKSIIGWMFILTLLIMQFVPRIIPGDEKLTLEGNRYGLYMFESNHQCISEYIILNKDGTNNTINRVSNTARHRCNPYIYWFKLKQRCEQNEEIQAISWKFDHSINGRPFLRIVDEKNICELEYKPFSHNNWIKAEFDNPEVIGWPVKNYYY